MLEWVIIVVGGGGATPVLWDCAWKIERHIKMSLQLVWSSQKPTVTYIACSSCDWGRTLLVFLMVKLLFEWVGSLCHLQGLPARPGAHHLSQSHQTTTRAPFPVFPLSWLVLKLFCDEGTYPCWIKLYKSFRSLRNGLRRNGNVTRCRTTSHGAIPYEDRITLPYFHILKMQT